MSNTMFIPKEIIAGFNSRTDTYTGKLAYVIYVDEKGVKRKEHSWNGWKDDKIPAVTEQNEAVDGFVINKQAGGGGYSSWNTRRTTARVYDPRGWEIEISIENLLFILEHTNSIKGKGLEGEFVYAWDGKDLVLLPVGCEDYKNSKEYSHIMYNKTSIKAKDLIIGNTYSTKNGEQVYLGKYIDHNLKVKKKVFYFMEIDKRYGNYVRRYSSVSKKFIKDSGEKHESFDEYFKKLDSEISYSPIDETKTKYFNITEKDIRLDNWNRYVTIDGKEENIIVNSETKMKQYEENNKRYGMSYNRQNQGTSVEGYLKLNPRKKIVYLESGFEYKRLGFKDSYYH